LFVSFLLLSIHQYKINLSLQEHPFLVTITVNRKENREERIKTTFTSTKDTSLDLNTNDNLYVGGIPIQALVK